MNISVSAVGYLKKGPEYELTKRYFQRFARSAPLCGLSFSGIREISESRCQAVEQRKQEESVNMLSILKRGSYLIVLDECGRSVTSQAFVDKITSWRDSGKHDVMIALGGPDGHSQETRHRANLILSFGMMTWPHRLARIMVAEQLYRATTILCHHPYHRDQI